MVTTLNQNSGPDGANTLYVALIGPEEGRRKQIVIALAGARKCAVQEYPFYPAVEDISGLLERRFDLVLVDLDSDTKYALSLVTHICRAGSVIAMGYSEQSGTQLLMSCKEAGADKFLTLPITSESMAEALAQVAGRQDAFPTLLKSHIVEPAAEIAKPKYNTPQTVFKPYRPALDHIDSTAAPLDSRPQDSEFRLSDFVVQPAIVDSEPDSSMPRFMEPAAAVVIPEVRASTSESQPHSSDFSFIDSSAGMAQSEESSSSFDIKSFSVENSSSDSSTKTPSLAADSAFEPELRTFRAEPRTLDSSTEVTHFPESASNLVSEFHDLEPRSFESSTIAANSRFNTFPSEARQRNSVPYFPEPAAETDCLKMDAPPTENQSQNSEACSIVSAAEATQPVDSVPSPKLRLPNPRLRSYEPATGGSSGRVRTSSLIPRLRSPEPRSFDAASGGAGGRVRTSSLIPRLHSSESHSFEPTTGVTNFGKGTPAAETRGHGLEAHSCELAGGGAAPAAQASAVAETRLYEPVASAANPVAHILNSNTSSSVCSNSQPGSELHFSSVEVSAVKTEIRPVIAEQSPVSSAVSAVLPEVQAPESKVGKMLVFLGTKGGCGTTSIACNFSVSLAHESGKKTLLIDLNLPLGNVSLELGLRPQYSVADALRNARRLDASFFSKLLAKHRSGLFVLASPDKFVPLQNSKETIDKLLSIARQEFDYVVIDAGSRMDLSNLSDTVVLEKSATAYLVTQDNVAELRNANRLINEYFSSDGPNFEVVLNRYTSQASGKGVFSSHLTDEKYIVAALTKSPEWKIPPDSFEVLLPVEGSRVARIFQDMARKVCGQAAVSSKKKWFGRAKKNEQVIKLLK